MYASSLSSHVMEKNFCLFKKNFPNCTRGRDCLHCLQAYTNGAGEQPTGAISAVLSHGSETRANPQCRRVGNVGIRVTFQLVKNNFCYSKKNLPNCTRGRDCLHCLH